MNYLLEALCKKLEGEIAMAYANIKAYERNVVGIGEHPEIVHVAKMKMFLVYLLNSLKSMENSPPHYSKNDVFFFLGTIPLMEFS